MRTKEFAETVGTAAIVISLIVLIVEVRQNTAAVQSGVVQSATEIAQTNRALFLTTPELREAFNAVFEEEAPTNDQRILLDQFYSMSLQINVNRFEQMRIGLIDRDFVLANGGNSRMFRRADFREFWDREKDAYPAEFRQFVEEVLMTPVVYRND